MKENLAKAVLNTLPRSLMNRLAGEFLPVFMLHSMVDHDNNPDERGFLNLKRALEYTRKKKYEPILLDELFLTLIAGKPLPENSVCFTVDDGFKDQFEIIAPVFSDYDVPLTCFVITDFINGVLWPWDAQVNYVIGKSKINVLNVKLPNGEVFSCELNEINRKYVKNKLIFRLKEIDQTNIYAWLPALYLSAEIDIPTSPPAAFQPGSWASLNKFQAQGHKVAAHSRSHRILSKLSAIDSKQEILGSYKDLKSQITNCSDVFAFPSGRACDFGEKEQKIIANSSLKGAVSAISSRVKNNDSFTSIPRYGLPNNVFDFIQYLSYLEAIKEMFRNS